MLLVLRFAAFGVIGAMLAVSGVFVDNIYFWLIVICCGVIQFTSQEIGRNEK